MTDKHITDVIQTAMKFNDWRDQFIVEVNQRITSVKALDDWKDQFMIEVDKKVASVHVALREIAVEKDEKIMNLKEKVISLQENCENIRKIPGPKGDRGIAGAPGPKGDTGAIGPSGVAGIAGTKGHHGFPGLPGLKGQKGDNGAVGPSGPVGIKGSKGYPGIPGLKECWNYNILNESTRNVNYKEGVRKSDRKGSEFESSPAWKGLGWYRFMGPAGTRMPESPPVFTSWATGVCGTHYTGWLNGTHPTTNGDLVRREVNFKRNPSKTNDGYPKTIKIRHCGSYFVYYLPDVTNCFSRYCAE